jgi:hypothetical protein
MPRVVPGTSGCARAADVSRAARTPSASGPGGDAAVRAASSRAMSLPDTRS